MCPTHTWSLYAACDHCQVSRGCDAVLVTLLTSASHNLHCTPILSNTREVGPCKYIFGQFLLTALWKLWKWEENSHRIADDRGQELGIKRSCDDTEPRPQLDPARPRISASSHFSSVSFHHISSVSSRAAKTNDFHNRFHQQSAVSCEERRRSN